MLRKAYGGYMKHSKFRADRLNKEIIFEVVDIIIFPLSYKKTIVVHEVDVLETKCFF